MPQNRSSFRVPQHDAGLPLNGFDDEYPQLFLGVGNRRFSAFRGVLEMPMVTLRRNMEPTIVKKLPYDFPAVHGYVLHIFCVICNVFTMQAVVPCRRPHTVQTLGKGVHSGDSP